MAKSNLRLVTPGTEKRTVITRQLKNAELRAREHLTDSEVEKLIEAAKANRFSNRPVGVKRFQTIHRHGVGVTRGLVLLFSNRPVGVKRFQTIHRHGVGVTRGLVLLYGIGT